MTTTKKLNFTILLASGAAINQTTLLKRNGIPYIIENNEQICDLIKKDWCKETKSKSFTDWANVLNEDENFEGTFTKYDALDNLSGMYQLNINRQHVNLYDFFLENKPFK